MLLSDLLSLKKNNGNVHLNKVALFTSHIYVNFLEVTSWRWVLGIMFG
jgi:hypothetical protein